MARSASSRPTSRRPRAKGADAERRPRRPGRPEKRPGRRHVRDRLLDAAGRLFTQRGSHEVSIRELARAADVTPAMVHYYFGDKQGLYDAMLERVLTRLLARVREVAEGRRGEPGGLAAILDLVIGTLSADSWIPPLIIREVIADAGRFRERFIELYATPLTQILRGILRDEMAARPFRRDLDLQLAMVSLLGMTAWPFAARPVVERVLGLRYDADFATTFAEHTRRLFLEGVRASGNAR